MIYSPNPWQGEKFGKGRRRQAEQSRQTSQRSEAGSGGGQRQASRRQAEQLSREQAAGSQTDKRRRVSHGKEQPGNLATWGWGQSEANEGRSQ